MSVVDTRRANRFAGSATETTINMEFESRRAGCESTFFDGTHQVDAAARAIVFISREDVGGTRFKAQPAMNASK
jgi:hypothetical protein